VIGDATSAPDNGEQAGAQERAGASGGLPGVVVAGMTALISGLSVFVNSYGVHSIAPPSVYTTAKNLVATLILAAVALVAWGLRRRKRDSVAARFVGTTRGSGSPRHAPASWRSWGPARWAGLAYVGIVGGGIAFVLFFEGLAETTATPAAFWRDTLVVWVAVLALVLLRERVAWWNVTAIAVLVVGQVAIAGGVGHLAADRGELLVLAATLLWAVEVVVAKFLLRDVAPAALALVRMGIGALTLIVYLAATGALRVLVAFHTTQVGWALLTGLLLAAYVGTWMTALARARAVDVTSVLVGSALITALLQAAAGTTSLAPQALGLLLVTAGASVVIGASLRHPSTPGRDTVRG
jgi:drug/metabolite transporter (DMT)-like permease